MIASHADGNLILQQTFKFKSDRHCITAYNAIMTRLAACRLSVDLQILDNKASSTYKEAITFKWNATFQLVPQTCITAIRRNTPFARSRTTSWQSWPVLMWPFHLTFGTSFSCKLNSPSIPSDRPLSTLGSVCGIFFRGPLTSTRCH
jgi:hypothetical protein